MKNPVKNTIRSCLALLMALILMIGCTGSAFAENTEDTVRNVPMASGSCSEYTSVTAHFHEMLSDTMRDAEISYSDEFFQRDENTFYMDLARASWGLEVSSFRDTYETGVSEDANVLSFLAQAGFENPQSDWYDQDPTEDSIASVIAAKEADGFTIVALVCCGGDYGDEWMSNLTVGSGTEHEGFASAATICQKRLQSYLDQNEITGDIRLWIAGYSRASAVGNLLAARLTEAGTFTAVYAYLFATPNTTQEPVAWSNIFNIIGQNDPVAMAPLTVWGYGRNGVDLYTPAQEANSSYTQASRAADEVSLALTDISFHNNPELNRQLHVVFEAMAAIFPTAEDYAGILQPQLLSVYQEHSGSDLLTILQEALGNIQGFGTEKQAAVKALISYLDSILYEYISGNEDQEEDGNWSTDSTLSGNIMLEHSPAVYASWIFSTDDPAGLFVSSTATSRLVVEGNFDLELWDDAGIVQTVSAEDEETLYEPGDEGRPADADLVCLYADNQDGKAVISLPQDRDFTLKLRFTRNSTVSLFNSASSYGNESSADSGSSHVSDVTIFRARKGDCIVLQELSAAEGVQVTMEDGSAVRCLRENLSSDITSVITRELLMGQNYTLSGIMRIACILLLALLAALGTALVLALAGRKRRRPHRTALTVCFAVISAIFLADAVFYRVVLPNYAVLTAVPAVLALLFAGLVVLRCRKRPEAGLPAANAGQKRSNSLNDLINPEEKTLYRLYFGLMALLLLAIEAAQLTLSDTVTALLKTFPTVLTGIMAIQTMVTRGKPKAKDRPLAAAMMVIGIADILLCFFVTVVPVMSSAPGMLAFCVIEFLIMRWLGCRKKSAVLHAVTVALMVLIGLLAQQTDLSSMLGLINLGLLLGNLIQGAVRYRRVKTRTARLYLFSAIGIAVCDYSIMVRTVAPTELLQKVFTELSWLGYVPFLVLMLLTFHSAYRENVSGNPSP